MSRSADNLTAVLQDTADAIRAKTGSSASICPRDFADEIAALPSGVGIQPYLKEYTLGYVQASSTNPCWKYENTDNNRSDFFFVRAGYKYIFSLPAGSGNRNRGIFIAASEPFTPVTDVTATASIINRQPSAGALETPVAYTPVEDGVVIFQKTNDGTDDIILICMETPIA